MIWCCKCAAIALTLCSCAETKLSLADAKHPASVRMASDLDNVELEMSDHHIKFRATRIDNSTPSRIRGDSINKVGTALSGVIVAGAAKGLLP